MNKLRITAALLAGLIASSVAGCGGNNVNAQSTPDRGAPIRQPEARRPGLTGKQKVLLLAGAAAVYYMYKKHQNAQGEGPTGKYYLSKNGRVYYRDLKTGKFQWVDPPSQPIQVPADEYERYTGQPMGPSGPNGVIRDAPASWPGAAAYGGARGYQ